MDSDKLLNLATSLGCLLAESGAEISRVEESVYRLLQAYQGKDAQVFAIPSCLIVSLMAEDGRPVTRMRRISAHGTDLELLESCNALCRQLCRTVPPLDEARAMLVRVMGRFSPVMAEFIDRAFEERWIDVYENKGKTTGAYSNGSAYGVHPYVLLNFRPELDGLLTLAHEMGHAMHSYYSNHTQPFIKSDYTIFVAEVASTCNEVPTSATKMV